MRALLIATYELGRQPFGIASAAAWLSDAGHRVACLDLSRQKLDESAVRQAEFVGLYVPMHTATRIAIAVMPRIRRLNPNAHLCFFGTYAPLNEVGLRELGADSILGGEVEADLVQIVEKLDRGEPSCASRVSLSRQRFLVPDRSGLPGLRDYSRLCNAGAPPRVVGYTEATRGCKHSCRHCPVVPIYRGAFRAVQRDVVLEDIRQQVEAGAEHITFGDPDFFNGPRHAMRLVEALHRAHPAVTYDATIKVEHLLEHADLLPVLRDTGCALVTTAAESFDDLILARLDKGHTRDDVLRAIELLDDVDLAVSPTFIPFTPWTTVDGYRDLLRTIGRLGLVDNVAPVQLALRLLVPAGSRLLQLDDLELDPFDTQALCFPWRHRQPEMDELAAAAMALIERESNAGSSRLCIFADLCRLAGEPEPEIRPARTTIPFLDEPWYC